MLAATGSAPLHRTILLATVLAAITARAEEGTAAIVPLAGRVGESVVRLAIFNGEDEKGNGTGFLIREDGIVVTNHHVVDHASGKMYAIFRDGKKVPVLGSLALDEEHDLAVLKIEGAGYPILELAEGKSIQVGQQVLLIGSSFGFDQSVGLGIVSALRPEGYPEEWKKKMKKSNAKIVLGPLLQHTVTAAPGASGSPLVDADGKVVSIHHSGFGDSEINFSAHVDALRALLAKTDLGAAPVPVGSNLLQNLLISAAVFGGMGLLVAAVPTWQRLARRRRALRSNIS